MSTGNEFTLLKDRRFLPFFITQFLGAFNDNVFKNALIILIAFSGGGDRCRAIQPADQFQRGPVCVAFFFCFQRRPASYPINMKSRAISAGSSCWKLSS
jgi:hypothetical protein